MSNAITEFGLQKDTAAQTLNKFLVGTEAYPGMLTIYGDNINVGPNSPDGQFINIGVQFTQDMLEFVNQVYTSFDPDQAIGVSLDQRCAINGVVRNAGTYTYTDVLVTVTQAVTLPGLDTAPTAPFTVSDASGNQFFLVATKVFAAAGSATLSFRAAVLGVVEAVPNTITVITTITLGVASVNNPAAATVTGTAEETDYALRIRRARSVALPSKGYFDGLYGALVDISGVTSVKLIENTTDTPVAYGATTLAGHSIWAVVQGGANADIAQAIYVKRNAGCGLKGAQAVVITQVDNSLFTVNFDRPTAQNLWIKLSVHAVTGTVDTAYLKTQLLTALTTATTNTTNLLPYVIGQSAASSPIVAFIQSIAPNASVSAEGVSTDGTTFVSLVNTTSVNYQFAVASARITITEI